MSSSMEGEKVSLLSLSPDTRELIRCPPVIGTLKGYDQLMNLVLDDVKELLRGNSYYPLSY